MIQDVAGNLGSDGGPCVQTFRAKRCVSERSHARVGDGRGPSEESWGGVAYKTSNCIFKLINNLVQQQASRIYKT